MYVNISNHCIWMSTVKILTWMSTVKILTCKCQHFWSLHIIANISDSLHVHVNSSDLNICIFTNLNCWSLHMNVNISDHYIWLSTFPFKSLHNVCQYFLSLHYECNFYMRNVNISDPFIWMFSLLMLTYKCWYFRFLHINVNISILTYECQQFWSLHIYVNISNSYIW